jgi:hydroxymethylbilane synthase
MSSTPAAPPVAAVVLGTRASALARAQTERVVELLAAAWPGIACEARPIVTRGDRTQSSGEPLPEIGGKGLFTAELENALRAGHIDLAVHSLKDLPTEEPVGIVLGAVCLREDVRDCLVARDGLALAELPAGAVVGTSSLRRAAQLRALRPDLEVRSIRGNVDTRVRKVREGEFDAVVLAAAGILRLGLADAVTEWLSGETMLPAPGQGALAVQCRADDERVLALLAPIDDLSTRAAATAERAFLRQLGAGCTAPVAAYAQAMSSEPSDNLSQGPPLHLRMAALVASPDGQDIVRVEGEGEPDQLGGHLAREALAAGAGRILDAIRGVDLVALSHKVGTLSGRRVVVTRPREQAAALAERLERLGASVFVVPLVAIEPVEDTEALDVALGALDRYDWVVFTSANGVAAIGERLAGALGEIRVAAVGPATAAAVRALGVEPSFVPERFAAEEVVGGLGPLSGSQILLPQADIADPGLAEALQRRGAIVHAVPAYRTVEVERTASELAELRAADAVVLASGSAARSLAARGGASDGTLLVCIGPKTAAVAREVGLPVGLVADEATADGIIQALVAHFGRQSGNQSE